MGGCSLPNMERHSRPLLVEGTLQAEGSLIIVLKVLLTVRSARMVEERAQAIMVQVRHLTRVQRLRAIRQRHLAILRRHLAWQRVQVGEAHLQGSGHQLALHIHRRLPHIRQLLQDTARVLVGLQESPRPLRPTRPLPRTIRPLLQILARLLRTIVQHLLAIVLRVLRIVRRAHTLLVQAREEIKYLQPRPPLRIIVRRPLSIVQLVLWATTLLPPQIFTGVRLLQPRRRTRHLARNTRRGARSILLILPEIDREFLLVLFPLLMPLLAIDLYHNRNLKKTSFLMLK